MLLVKCRLEGEIRLSEQEKQELSTCFMTGFCKELREKQMLSEETMERLLEDLGRKTW